MSKVWFAKKLNGDVISLTEKEALTHFEQNNIASRMRLTFIGTSDGKIYDEARKEASRLLNEKMAETYPNYRSMSREERAIAKMDTQEIIGEDLKKIIDDGFQNELEQAKKNGVQQPDASLRIITKKDGGDANERDRQKIINSIG